MARTIYQLRLAAILGFLALLILRGPVAIQANQSHIRCDSLGAADSGEFCATVYQMRQRILADSFFAWWMEWADEHEVLIELHSEWPAGAMGAWPTMNKIGATPDIVDDSVHAARLVHEITHLMDYPCNQDPWSHERVYFWQMVALANLRAKDCPGDLRAPCPLPDEFWGLWTIQTGFEIQAKYFPYGLGEPCRVRGVPETAPHGITYSWLKPLLGWWD